jgi:glucose/mannose-6-phosphate isomerase
MTPGTEEMFRLVASLPGQLADSATLDGLGKAGDLPAGCRRIILCGLGGSAIAGDLVRPLVADSGLSLTVHRDYGLPPWAAPGDLAVCSSYSGDTEETLSAARVAAKRGLDRVVISTGGQLGAMAASEGLRMVTLPAGLPPRASLGYGLGALVRLLGAWGVVSDAEGQISSAIAHLTACAEARGVEATGNDPAGHPRVAELAEDLVGRTAVIHTAGDIGHPAGVRLRAQINENSKRPACLASYPELDHNELEGWSLGADERARFALIILQGPDPEPRMSQRIRVTRDLLAPEFAAVHEIVAGGDTPLARIMDLVQYGDFLSCHLARLIGVDAMPVDRIGSLKKALGSVPGDG